MSPAPAANDPRCAAVIVRLPDSVAGQSRDDTDAQATGAWGNPVRVQLTCGLAPIGPTTDPCVTATSGTTSVDWVLESDPSARVLSYITYGRTPAVRVTIAHAEGGVSDADVLNELVPAVAAIPADASQRCVGATDAP